jgi:hypothetical protein
MRSHLESRGMLLYAIAIDSQCVMIYEDWIQVDSKN